MSDELIEIYQGDDKSWEISVVDQDDVEVDITAATEITFSVKQKFSDTSFALQIKMSDDTQIELSGGVGNEHQFKLHLIPADTSGLAGDYQYDFQLEIGGKVYTIMQGTFRVNLEVT